MELLNVGGNANNRSLCGLSYANSNNGFSNSRTNIGARLNYYTHNVHLYPTVKNDIMIIITVPLPVTPPRV